MVISHLRPSWNDPPSNGEVTFEQKWPTLPRHRKKKDVHNQATLLDASSAKNRRFVAEKKLVCGGEKTGEW